jgi:iron(III) transport system ATP-binding protein
MGGRHGDRRERLPTGPAVTGGTSEECVASVELRSLSKAYGTQLAVNGISLHIDHGLLVCLLRPSGCGKTTTLRLLAGFMAPTSGEIRVGERIVSTPE